MEQPGYGYTRSGVTASALQKLTLTLCGASAYLYNQDVAAVNLTPLTPDFTPAAEGRAFGPQAEVRWEQDPDTPGVYTVLVLSEQAQTLPGVWQTEKYEAVSQQIYLLGAWQPEEQAWIEVRLPHPLAYPLKGPADAMARLTAQAWEYRKDGIVQYIRWEDLKTEPIQSSSEQKEARDG